MELTPAGFELSSKVETRTALDALNYQIDAIQASGARPESSLIFLRGWMRLSNEPREISCNMPESGKHMPYLEHLTDALTVYSQADVPQFTGLLGKIRLAMMTETQKKEARRRPLQQQVARRMLIQIDEGQGISEFRNWLDTVAPEEFSTQGND